MTTREQAIARAALGPCRRRRERAGRTPQEAAAAASYPGHPLGSIGAIEAEIIRRRQNRAQAVPSRYPRGPDDSSAGA